MELTPDQDERAALKSFAATFQNYVHDLKKMRRVFENAEKVRAARIINEKTKVIANQHENMATLRAEFEKVMDEYTKTDCPEKLKACEGEMEELKKRIDKLIADANSDRLKVRMLLNFKGVVRGSGCVWCGRSHLDECCHEAETPSQK